MRLSKPRIPPTAPSEWTDEQMALLQPLTARGSVFNIFKTLIREPAAYKAFMAWGGYILSRRNALPAREREIVILRTGWLCRSGYEWAQHVVIGRREGLSDADIARLKAPADAPGWSDAERALIVATDDLHTDRFISDASWALLKVRYTDKQCMDLVFTVGQYTQVSMMLNSFGVQLDAGLTLDPDLDARAA